jgi:hypothetical protein
MEKLDTGGRSEKHSFLKSWGMESPFHGNAFIGSSMIVSSFAQRGNNVHEISKT